jgi:hypothetical protein
MNDRTRIKRDKSSKKMYNDLIKREGPLKGYNTSDIFLLSLAIGYSKSYPSPIKESDPFVKPENFGKDLIPLTEAIAISESEEGIEILAKDKNEVYKLAEEYANAGIELLYAQYKGNEKNIITDWYREIYKDVKNKKMIEFIDKEL